MPTEREPILRPAYNSAERHGTLLSSTFAVMSTMIGGGTLSVPFAYSKGGVLLSSFLTAVAACMCYVGVVPCLISISRATGEVTYEKVVELAFGRNGKVLSMLIVAFNCWVPVVAYCILIRDLTRPVANYVDDHFYQNKGNEWMIDNGVMLSIVLLVTPLTMLRTLASLRYVTVFSITNITFLGLCLIYKGSMCNFASEIDILGDDATRHENWIDYVHFFPLSWEGFLDALPIFIGPFICHFNALPIHNELDKPTVARVEKVFGMAMSFGVIFYMSVGTFGSLYGNCTESGSVSGNILLDFSDDDVLISIGRVCLTLSLSLSLPLFVLPCRDTLMRMINGDIEANPVIVHVDQKKPYAPPEGIFDNLESSTFDETETSSLVDSSSNVSNKTILNEGGVVDLCIHSDLHEPLLLTEFDAHTPDVSMEQTNIDTPPKNESTSWKMSIIRIFVTLLILWGGAVVAANISSVAVVWDLAGSTLCILIGFLLPCGSLLKIDSMNLLHHAPISTKTKMICWVITLISFPVMIICTANSILNI